MLTREENLLLTQTGPDTPRGKLMRRHWLPALLSEELPELDGEPKQVRLLGEDFVAFRRDTTGRVDLRILGDWSHWPKVAAGGLSRAGRRGRPG